MGTRRGIFALLLFFIAVILTPGASGQERPKPREKQNQPPSSPKTSEENNFGVQPYQAKRLVAGATAYVRVKEQTTSAEDGLRPKGTAFKVKFADAVLLIKADEKTHVWLVEKGGKKGWLLSSYLTANREELDFLRKTKKIPLTTTLISVTGDGLYLQGYYAIRMFAAPFSTVAKSAPPSYDSEKNAVFIDESVIKITPPPLTLKCGKKKLRLLSDAMYYCSRLDKNGECCFDCIDLDKLSMCGE